MEKQKKRRLTKIEKHNIKQKFVRDYSTGKYELPELVKKYNVTRITLLKFKIQVFGKGSIKQRLAFQMKSAGVPCSAIAEYFNTHITVIHLWIRKEASNHEKKKER